METGKTAQTIMCKKFMRQQWIERKTNRYSYRNRKLYIIAGLNVGNGKPCPVYIFTLAPYQVLD